jgi:NAD(P)-dependent dehydrogenase (short-subunit alcohol dehydrogenase family)
MAWILVTGGAKRLGAQLCLTLAKQGHSVVVHYCQSEKEAYDVVAQCRLLGGKAEALQGDFSTQEGVEQFITHYLKQFPQTEALINNVGNYLIQPATQTEAKKWMDLFQTNLHAPFLLSCALKDSLIASKGQIINLGVSGVKSPSAHTHATAYYLTKLSLWGLTLALAKELAPYEVCVNMVSPGYLENSVDFPKDPTKLPMHRPGSCSEVARMVTFLLDPANHYITGQNIEVAGGVGL